jgi:hypothetical protein
MEGNFMDYINTFLEIKQLTEDLWDKKNVDKIYGYQFQPKTKWKDGLSPNQINEFEKAMGFEFPEILKDYYSVMNGVDKENVNAFGDNGYSYAYSTRLYSYPGDIQIIDDLIQWIYDENRVDFNEEEHKNISRIFPVYAHYYILIDHPAHPILSMYGDEIVHISNSLTEFFYKVLAERGEGVKTKIIGYGWIDR